MSKYVSVPRQKGEQVNFQRDEKEKQRRSCSTCSQTLVAIGPISGLGHPSLAAIPEGVHGCCRARDTSLEPGMYNVFVFRRAQLSVVFQYAKRAIFRNVVSAAHSLVFGGELAASVGFSHCADISSSN